MTVRGTKLGVEGLEHRYFLEREPQIAVDLQPGDALPGVRLQLLLAPVSPGGLGFLSAGQRAAEAEPEPSQLRVHRDALRLLPLSRRRCARRLPMR